MPAEVTPAVLYENRIKIGVIADWTIVETPAQFKTVLGKTFETSPSSNRCTFTSPKPVKRKSELKVIAHSIEYTLGDVHVKNGTLVEAKILKRSDVGT